MLGRNLDTLDRKHGMLYLIHRACSLPCHHAYVYFQFIHAMLSLPVFMLKVTRTYSVFMTDPFSFASFSSILPPGSQGGKHYYLVGTSFCFKVIIYGLDLSWLWLLYCFTWGMIYDYGFMPLYYCKTEFDVMDLMAF